MLLVQQQEAGIEIDAEQQDFLADGSINGDEAVPSYDSDILSEVPNYDNYHENDMFNLFVQEFPYSEQPISVNDTYVDFLNDTNVISDNPHTDN
ncbi:hypothetical protein Tco_0818173 [Tanacetum coccineum]